MEWAFQELPSCFGELESLRRMALALTILAGLQAHIYISEFRRQGAQGDSVWKCAHTRDDQGHARVNCIHRNAGLFASTLVCIISLTSLRFALPCRRRPFFPGQIPSQIQRRSTMQ